MDIKIDMDKDTINQEIASAIIQSVLGDHIKEAIQFTLNKADSPYANSVQKVVEIEVATIIKNLLQNEYHDKLKEAVRQRITDEVVQKVIGAAWDCFFEKLHK